MRILITGAGFQGGYTFVQELHKRDFEVIGVDFNGNSAAKYYCDKFYQVPSGEIKNQYYVPALKEILEMEKPDVLLPASQTDLRQLAFHRKTIEKYTKLMVADTKAIRIALDKSLMYDALSGEKIVPRAFYSEKGLCLKPMMGKGAREIQYLNDNHFVMEKLEGEEIDIDVIAWKGEVLLAECKTRERAYGGTMIEGEIVERSYLAEQIKTIIKKVPIDYLSVIQFKGDKLLEVNPRMAGAIIDWEIPMMAINLALGKITPKEIKNYQVPIGKRIARFMHQYEI